MTSPVGSGRMESGSLWTTFQTFAAVAAGGAGAAQQPVTGDEAGEE